MRVLGIAGSLGKGSHNLALLRAAAALLLPPDAELQEWSGFADLAAYNGDLDGRSTPVAVSRLRQAIADADAMITRATRGPVELARC